MSKYPTLPIVRIVKADGAAYPNGKLDLFVSGTSTPATAYTDKNRTTAHSNPVIADANGVLPTIYLDPAVSYRVRGRDQDGANIAGFDFDPIGADAVFNVRDFGAIGDGATNDTDAFAAASLAVSAANGGTLVVPPGTYIVGKQTRATGTLIDNTVVYNQGYAYFAHDIIRIARCARPVRVIGTGAFLKAADGLRYGAFDPASGLPIAGPTNDPNQQAHAYAFVYVHNCSGPVEVAGLDIDGNLQNFVTGGLVGDKGRQTGAYGILLYDNGGPMTVGNCRARYCGFDGLYIENIVADPTTTPPTLVTDSTPVYPVLVENCEFSENGRPGFTWAGGNQLTAIGCKFNRQGRADFGGLVAGSGGSPPQAGVDLEDHGSIVKNGVFIKCEFADNAGQGLSADSDTGRVADFSFIDCRFIGTTDAPIWVRAWNFRFHNCMILGKLSRVTDHVEPEKATRFYGGTVSLNTSRSPRPSQGLFGQGSALVDLVPGSNNVVFDGVHFDSSTHSTHLLINASGATVRNCSFNHGGSQATTVDVTWEGVNRITAVGTVHVNGVRRGPVIRNGTVLPVELTVAGSTFSAAASGEGKMMGLSGGGLTLFGRGSVGDVNLSNYQGSTALAVMTGTNDVRFYGKLLLNDLAKIPDYAGDTQAAAGGVALGQVYRTGSTLKVRVA
jgi:hypothetical protein